MKWVWNPDGFEEIRRSTPVQREVFSTARRVAKQAGAGFEVSGRQRRKGPAPSYNRRRGAGFQGRYGVIVYPKTYRAMRRNASENVLAKLAGGGW